MEIRPYLTYQGECNEAIALYREAFNTEVMQVLHMSDMPDNPEHPVGEEFKDQVMQCTMKMGNSFMRMSDCGGGLNAPESERISIAVECTEEEVRHAFEVLAKEGRVGMPLAETFYSPCAGVVFDKFGVMWNFVAQK